MSSVNKVILIGNAGRDPEVRHTASGTAVANLALATSERYKDKNGEQQEKTEWHRVVFWERLAEIVGQYVTKGSKVYIEGSLETRKYTDKDGVEKYATEIKAREMRLLSPREGAQPQPRPAPQKPAPQAARPAQQRAPAGFEDMADDIPF